MHITQEKTQENLRDKLRVNWRKFSSLIPQMGQVGRYQDRIVPTFREYSLAFPTVQLETLSFLQIFPKLLNLPDTYVSGTYSFVYLKWVDNVGRKTPLWVLIWPLSALSICFHCNNPPPLLVLGALWVGSLRLFPLLQALTFPIGAHDM